MEPVAGSTLFTRPSASPSPAPRQCPPSKQTGDRAAWQSGAGRVPVRARSLSGPTPYDPNGVRAVAKLRPGHATPTGLTPVYIAEPRDGQRTARGYHIW